ncbi:MAG: TetR/AcrR family transcriptional regulator [Aggregatilineaceae bacterium]
MIRGRFRQQQWHARQEAIVAALEQLSTERGMAGITMDDLAEAVGISKATLYQHFASKEAMLAHLLTAHYSQFIEWLDSTAGQPPIERLCATMRYLMSGQLVALREVMALGREQVLPLFYSDAGLIAQHTRTLQLLADIVRQGQADGSITPDLAPQAVIGAMWALSNLSARQSPGAQALPEALDKDTYAEQMLLLFVRSLRPAF